MPAFTLPRVAARVLLQPFLAPVQNRAEVSHATEAFERMVSSAPLHAERPPAEAGKGSCTELVLIPHEGMLFLDHPGGDWWQLTHTGTGERCALPAPPPGCAYELVFDDTGFGVVLCIDSTGSEQEDAAIFAEDMLQLSFYQESDDGGKAIVRHSPGGGEPSIVRLDDFSRQFVQSVMKATCGPARKVCDFDVAIFRWARGASKVFISATSLYSGLALRQFGGQSSRWIYNSRPRWQKLMASCSIREGVQMSYLVGKSGTNADASGAGVLPFTGLSPAALLLLLDRFSLRSARHGGLTTPDARLNASWLLEALLCPVMQELRGQAISFDMVRSWACVYPRPKVFEFRVDFVVTGDALVDISAWGEAAVGRPRSFASKAWESVRASCRQPLHIADLLKVLGQPETPLLHSLFAQLICELGFRLHGLLLTMSKQDSPFECLRMRKVDISDSLADRCDMDRQLAQYVATAKQKTRGRQYWSGCSDKSAVGGFSLQATLFAFGDNLAVVAPPAVRRGVGGAATADGDSGAGSHRQSTFLASVRCIRIPGVRFARVFWGVHMQ